MQFEEFRQEYRRRFGRLVVYVFSICVGIKNNEFLSKRVDKKNGM